MKSPTSPISPIFKSQKNKVENKVDIIDKKYLKYKQKYFELKNKLKNKK
jgi:hypothetical protein